MMEIKGLENSFPVRMIYLDDKSEVLFSSLAHANRKTSFKQNTIKAALNPTLRRKFTFEGREVVFRVYKNK